MTNDDRDLIDRLRAGDASVLEALVDRHWGGLVRYAFGLLHDWDRAEDAAQTAFVRLWAGRDRWTPGSTSALLFRIVRNQAFDSVKQARRRRSAPLPEGLPGGASPDRTLEATELARAAAAAVDELPERRREVYRLARDAGFSYAEIGEVMGLAPQTVANHMSLALADLRRALRPFLEPVSGGAGDPVGGTSSEPTAGDAGQVEGER